MLPTTTANAAVYLITGTLPIEVQLHTRTFSYLHNPAALDESSIERQILNRQLHMKSSNALAGYAVQRILWKYDLPSVEMILESTPNKQKWKTMIYEAVGSFWTDRINIILKLYSTF